MVFPVQWVDMELQQSHGGNPAKCFASGEYLASVCLYDRIYLAVFLRITTDPPA